MCYMNAIVQCLRVVPELSKALDDYEIPDMENLQHEDLHPAALTTGNAWLIFWCRTSRHPQRMYDM